MAANEKEAEMSDYHARHLGGGLIALYRGDEEVREIGITPGWHFKDRDEFIARYNRDAALQSEKARADAAEADARRYRWLRRKDAFKENYLKTKGGVSAIFVSDGRVGHATDTEHLDAAIDAVLGATND